MRKYWKWIVAGICIIVLALGLLNRGEWFFDKPFKVVPLVKESYVVNRTDYPYLDTIVHLGLKELNIPKTIVVIKTLDPTIMESIPGMELKAYVTQENGGYLIFIRSMGRKEAITVLSHEMIHIAQYYIGDIVVIDQGVLWKKAIVFPLDTPYSERPWEIQAFALQGELGNRISKQLY
jgi:hypothetical protein